MYGPSLYKGGGGGAVADPGFSQGAPTLGGQDTIFLNVPKNCMESRKIRSLGAPPWDHPL